MFRSYDLIFRRDEDITLGSKYVDWMEPGPAFAGSIYKACRASTAAPTYFKAENIDGINHIDGGTKVGQPRDLLECFAEAAR